MKLSEVKEGMTLIADGGFGCLSEGQRCTVLNDGRLYVACRRGRHYLDGQSDDGELIGMEAVK